MNGSTLIVTLGMYVYFLIHITDLPVSVTHFSVKFLYWKNAEIGRSVEIYIYILGVNLRLINTLYLQCQP